MIGREPAKGILRIAVAVIAIFSSAIGQSPVPQTRKPVDPFAWLSQGMKNARAWLPSANPTVTMTPERRERNLKVATSMVEDGLAAWRNARVEPREVVGKALDFLVDIHLEAGNKTKAIEAARQAVEVRRQLHHGPHDKVACALDRLALLHAKLHQPDAELAVRREILDLLTQLHGPNHRTVIEARGWLDDRAKLASMEPGRRQDLEEARRSREKAESLRQAGKLDDALDSLRRALAGFEAVRGNRHQEYADCLKQLGRLHRERREYSAAEECLEQGLTILRETLGDRYPGTIEGMVDFARLEETRGDLIRATGLIDRALELREQGGGEDDGRLAGMLEDAGRLRLALGDYAGARQRLERATAIFVRLISGDETAPRPAPDRRRATMLDWILSGRTASPEARVESVYRFRDLSSVSTIYRPPSADRERPGRRRADPEGIRSRAWTMYGYEARNAKPTDPGVGAGLPGAYRTGEVRGEPWISCARTLRGLATVYQARGDARVARLLRLQSLAIGLEATDPSDETRAAFSGFLEDFTLMLQEIGELSESQDLAQAALLYRRRDPGERHPDFADGLDTLARVFWLRGDHAQATLLFERALNVRREALGEDHPDLANGLYRLALLHTERSDLDEARRRVTQALDLDESLTMATLPFLPERQRLVLLARTSRSLAAFLDLSGPDPEDASEAYRRLLLWKGIATEAAAAQRAAALTPGLRKGLEELSRLRDQLNRLYYATVPPDRREARAQQIGEIVERRTGLEAQLAAAVGWTPRSPTPARVIAELTEGSALVDIYRYMHYNPSTREAIEARDQPPLVSHFQLPVAEGPALRFEAYYVAFVLRPGRACPVRVDLGPAEPIERAIQGWLDAVERGDDVEALSRALARLVWTPLAPQVKGARILFISPDGAVNFLPWGALPAEAPGAYLVEVHAFGTIPAARRLLRPEHGSGAEVPAARGLLAVGGLDYDGSVPVADGLGGPGGAALRAAAITEAKLHFAGLDGTGIEADAVADLFRRDGPGALGEPIVRLSGRSASKPRVRTELAGKGVLHLATHGYFAPPHVASTPGTLGSILSGEDGRDAGHDEVPGLFPGLLSGLVFSGANRPTVDSITGMVDVGAGVMTAEEVAGLDLSGCGLVVLSACQTGLGRTADGEGVLGLQRAFHQAGARSVVASLWRVNDDVTRELMTLFYDNLWRRRLSPLESLRQAQLAMIHKGRVGEERRTLGKPEAAKPGPIIPASQPQLWGAWTISGDMDLVKPFGSPAPIVAIAKPVQTSYWSYAAVGSVIVAIPLFWYLARFLGRWGPCARRTC
jgi:CHAT domain-containing protein/tetratricopeptide (TPR) repeat protein